MNRSNRRNLVVLFLVGILLSTSFFTHVGEPVLANTVLGQKYYEKNYNIAPGVTLKKENFEGNNLRRAVNYLDVDINQSSLSVNVAMPQPLNQLTRITELAKRENREGHYVVGAINASYFETGGSTFPANLVVKNNEILHFGRNSPNENGPNFKNFAFGVTQDGKPRIAGYNPNLTVSLSGMPYQIFSINMDRATDKVTLYTPSHRLPTVSSTPTTFSTEIVVTNASKDMSKISFGDNVTGTISKISRLGETTNEVIPQDGFVISAHGAALGQQLSHLQVGQQVTFSVGIDSHWMNAQYMLATGPTLIQDGQVAISMNESSGFATERAPRTAVGITKNGRLILVTIDGRQPGYSNGASLRELAQYMISLGVDRAINLDGGGSTAIAARLQGLDNAYLVNRPSDGQERRVVNSIQIISTAPPATFSTPLVELDRFSSLSNWGGTGIKAKATASLSKQGEPVQLGNHSVRFDYEYLKEEGTAAAYLVAKQPLVLEGKPAKIGMWVHGDGKEHWLRMQIRDGASGIHYVNFTEENKMNWTGWKYVTANLPQNITPPYSIDRIYTVQTNIAKKGKGTLYFDKLEAIYDASHVPPQAPTTPAPSTPAPTKFSDVSAGHWAVKEIAFLVDQKVINGFPDGTFKPGANITREQAAIMLTRQLNLDTTNVKDPGFVDVKSDRPSYAAIAAVAQNGLLVGREAGYFNPQATMTRAETAVLLQRAYNLTAAQGGPTFPDVMPGHWAHPAVLALASNNLAKGQPDGTYGLNQSITRAEFSTFLYRLITR